MDISRRTFVAAAAAAPLAAAEEKPVICAFSKHFQWAGVAEMADVCASLGYPAIDLTVRGGGHVEPATVERDLPKAVETIRKAGLTVPMVTSGIIDSKSPYAENVLRTLAGLGIRRYRWGTFRYKEGPLPQQVEAFHRQAAELAALNARHGVCAMYHTHSGVNQVGASMWDLWMVLKGLDTNAVSVNYDVGHATVEGGYGGWQHSARLMLPIMRGVAVKDFKWKQNDRGAWVPGWGPLGEGMVNFKQFFAALKTARFSGPIQLHMEYPDLGGADTGKREFTIPKERLLAICKRDLDRLKAMLKEAEIVA